MRATPRHLTHGEDPSNATSYATASISSSARRLLLLAVYNRHATNAPVPSSVSGAGLTWTQVTSIQHAASGARLTVYRAYATTPASGAITISFGSTQTNCSWSIEEFSAVDSSSPVVQSATASGNSSAPAATLAAFGHERNGTYAAVGNNGVRTFTPASGYVELADVQVSGAENGHLSVEYSGENDTTPDGTLSGSEQWAVVAIELRGTVGPYILPRTSGTSSGTSATTASITPTPTRTVLVAVLNIRALPNVAPEPTLSGNGLTWVKVATVQDNDLDLALGQSLRVTVFRASGPSPTAGALTISFGGVSQTSIRWSVGELVAVDKSSPVVQFDDGVSGGPALALSGVLDNAAIFGAGSQTVASGGVIHDAGGLITSFLSDADDFSESNVLAIALELRDDAAAAMMSGEGLFSATPASVVNVAVTMHGEGRMSVAVAATMGAAVTMHGTGYMSAVIEQIVIIVPTPTPLPRKLYRYLIGDLIGNIREELPLSAVSYEPELNGAGSMTATIPITHPKATRANLEPAASAIYIERAGQLIWGGLLWVARADGAAVRLDFGGFWSYVAHRHIRETKEYADFEQAQLVLDLIDYMQSQPGGDIGLGVNFPDTGVLRSKLYEAEERKNIAAAIEELAAMDQGFEFSVDVSYDPTTGVARKVLEVGHPERGRELDATFELGVNMHGIPSWSIDGTRVANLIDVTGAPVGETLLIQSAQSADRGAYPLLESVISLRDEDVEAQLLERALAELGAFEQAPEFITVRLDPNAAETQVGAWGLGDTVPVKADYGYIQIPGDRYKIVGAKIDPQDDGAEQVTAELVRVG